MVNWKRSGNRKARRIRRNNSARSYFNPDFMLLERREMLAATLYVDFGFGFGEGGALTVSDAQVAPLGGPQVFGASHQITRFFDDMRVYYPNTTQQQVQMVVTEVLDQLNYLFAPFDVDIQYAESANLADVQARLQSTSTNDVYVFLGGAIPSSLSDSADVGAAVHDANNTRDNLAFVFPRPTDPNDRSNEDFFRTERYSAAAVVARQAGLTFGLSLTESTRPVIGHDIMSLVGGADVMSLVGTGTNGQPLTETGFAQFVVRHGFKEFLRADLLQRIENGISPGTQNTFDKLASIVGKRSGAPEVFTHSTGSNFDVNWQSDTSVQVTIDGLQYNGINASNGLEIRHVGLLTEGDSGGIRLLGRSYNLTESYREIRDDRQLVVRAKYYTGLVLTTDGFADIYKATGGLDGKSWLFDTTINLGNGADTFILDGADAHTYYRSGGGNDRFVFRVAPAYYNHLDGGTGNDMLDLSALSANAILHFWEVNENGFVFGYDRDVFPTDNFRHTAFESARGNIDGSLKFEWGFHRPSCHGLPYCPPPIPVPVRSSPFRAVVNGDTTVFSDTGIGKTFTAQNSASIVARELFLLATSRPMRLMGETIQISSSINPANGNLDSIQHDVTILENTHYNLIVSHRAGSTGLNMTHQTVSFPSPFPDRVYQSFSGLFASGNLLIESSESLGSIEIHGSNMARDVFHFPSIPAYPFPVPYLYTEEQVVTAFGHGGDDVFTVGSTIGAANGDLAVAFQNRKQLTFIGGAGIDRVFAVDQGASGRGFRYEISETGIRIPGREDSAPGALLQPILIDYSEVETVRVGGARNSKYQVTPSKTVTFVVDGSSDVNSRDTIALVETIPANRQHVVRSGINNGTWFFGNGPTDHKIVVFNSVEEVVQSSRFAVASQPGVPSLVRVYDTFSGTHLFNLNPYPAAFRGGVQVATGDVNGDGIADIVVAPGPGRYALVQIYDGRNGQFLTSFDAFPANNPNPALNFLGGADIALGNVLEDAQGGPYLEIIASTLTGSRDVRVFALAGPVQSGLQYQLITSFDPFSGNVGGGVRVATGDFNGDYLDDIVSALGPGATPQVAIHRNFASNNQGILHGRFLGYVASYRGGFHVSVSDVTGDGRPDVLLASVNSGSSSDVISGTVRVFDGSTLPTSSTATFIAPRNIIQAHSREARGISMRVVDSRGDGTANWIWTGVSLGGNASEKGQIKRFLLTPTIQHLDSFFAGNSAFNNGMEFG